MTVDSSQPASAPADIPSEYKLWRLSVEQYHAMARAGVLTENDPVELLEGWLVYKMTKNPPHSAATRFVRTALEQWIPSGYFVDSQEPITLINSEPEPDVFIVRGRFTDYVEKHPGPEDIALVVEVSDSTLAQDRGAKKRIYARAEIPVYWLVNLLERHIEVYTEPSGAVAYPDYHHRVDYRPGEEVPVRVDGCTVGHLAVDGLLP